LNPCKDRLPYRQPKVFYRNGCCTCGGVIVCDQGRRAVVIVKNFMMLNVLRGCIVSGDT